MPDGAAAQTLQGRVLDRATQAPLAGVSVELNGIGRMLTNAAGQFRFLEVRPGQYTLVVSGLGYRREQQVVALRADTSLTIQLDAEAVRIDSLIVAARTVTVRGEVRDAANGAEVIDAEVLFGPAAVLVTNAAGRFAARNVAAGVPHRLSVRAFGYLPAEVMVEAMADTMVKFRLEADPLVVRMIAEQVARIEQRSLQSTFGRLEFTRADLVYERQSSVADILRDRLGRRLGLVHCVIIDEKEAPAGIEILRSYLPDQFERIEALRNPQTGIFMVRAYTRDFIARMVASATPLRRIPTTMCA